jgi:hypothetical protein
VSKWGELELAQSQTESAIGQRIRYWSELRGLRVKRRGGLWYFATPPNELVSPETGLADREALDFVKGGI